MKSIINKLMYRLTLAFNFKNQPLMIQGYHDSKGVYLPEVKISNTVFIQDRSNLILEDHVFIGHFNFIESSNRITIGEGCQVTNFISILTHSSHRSIRLYGSHYQNQGELKGYLKGEVVIGRYTFIGPHCTIMPGSVLGKGCIVSAYSFVQGNYPDFSIISGNPATVIGDTRQRDKEFLMKEPGLIPYYESWAGKQF